MVEFLIYLLFFGFGILVGYKIEKSDYKPIGSEEETQKEKNEKEFEEKVIQVEEKTLENPID